MNVFYNLNGSVPRRTSTASSDWQFLNREGRVAVFPRPTSIASFLVWTSTVSQKICQIERWKACQKICQIECQKSCQKECQEICQKEGQQTISQIEYQKNVRKDARKNVRRDAR